MSTAVTYQVSNQVAYLILNRPEKRNAFDDSMIASMLSFIEQAASDSAIRALVLKANGDHFCAGGDLQWMQKMANFTPEENLQDAQTLATLMYSLSHFKKPTLAMVQGAVFGGGLGLVACCDTAIATQDALFCLSEVKLGLIPAVIGPYVMSAMGRRVSQHYMLTATPFKAEVALRHGLIHQSVNSLSDLEKAAEQWVSAIQKNAPGALSTLKTFTEEMAERPLDKALISSTAHYIASLRAKPEGQEGCKAFLEKRPPNWSLTEND